MNRNKQISDKLTYAGKLFFLSVGLLLAILQITNAAVTINCTSADQFFIDIGDGVQGQYVSYQIENTDPVAYTNVWVEITDFTGGVVSLAPLETNYYTFNILDPGETRPAFFYLQASNTTTTFQGHTINVYEGDPLTGTLLTSSTFGFTEVRESISAAANKISVIVAGPTPPIIGGILTITVDGNSGTIGSEGIMSFSPAGFLDWTADSFELISTEITLSGGNNDVLNDQLFYTAVNSRNTVYHAVYTFKVVGITLNPTLASPVATISSGNRLKHDKTDSYFIINPIEPPGNFLLLNKSVNPLVLTGGGTANYTLSFNNSGIYDVIIDAIEDRMPTYPDNAVYIAGTTLINGLPAADPLITDSVLYWPITLTIPAGGNAALTFDASFPSIEGDYINSAVAFIGNIQIDTTLDTTDDAPATALVVVGMPDIVMLKTVQTYSDPVNDTLNPKSIPGASMLYTIQISNQGAGAADTNSIFAADQIPINTSLFVGDIDSAGSGPVYFQNGSTPSGLNFTYSGLNSPADDVGFSDDGGLSFGYIPSPDPDGFDSNITNIMINPKGIFNGAIGGNNPSFSLMFRVRVR
jgi:hypothetical protein